MKAIINPNSGDCPEILQIHNMAQKYADHHFPILNNEISTNSVKHDIAFHSYCDGFNAALRVLMVMRNLVDPCQHHGDDPNFD